MPISCIILTLLIILIIDDDCEDRDGKNDEDEGVRLRVDKQIISTIGIIGFITFIFRFKAPYQSWVLTVQVSVTTLLVLLAILLLLILVLLIINILLLIMRNCRHLSLPIVSLLGASHGRKPAKSEPSLVVMKVFQQMMMISTMTTAMMVMMSMMIMTIRSEYCGPMAKEEKHLCSSTGQVAGFPPDYF